jgi:uncharacterized membrane protein
MKKCFLTGLITLLPLAFTFWFVHLIFSLLTKPFTDLVKLIWPNAPQGMTPLLVIAFLFVLTLGIGFVARKFFFSHLLEWGDKILQSIPFVSKIYKTSKELIHSLFGENKSPFNQVVLVPFPYPGAYCIGLLTAPAPLGENKTSVFIPTVPNPATGYLVVSDRDQLIYLNISSEEAIKYVLSCGVIQPGSSQTGFIPTGEV